MRNDEDSRDVTGRRFKVSIQDDTGEEFIGWNPHKQTVHISNDMDSAREALSVVESLADYLREWVESTPFPLQKT
jgi:hypothetical protein